MRELRRTCDTMLQTRKTDHIDTKPAHDHCFFSYLAVVAALASEADYVFIPEDPVKTDWKDHLCKKLLQVQNPNSYFLKETLLVIGNLAYASIDGQNELDLNNWQQNISVSAAVDQNDVIFIVPLQFCHIGSFA